MRLWGCTSVDTPLKSKLTLPSFAAIVVLNLPSLRRSFSAYGACQVSMAKAHCVMCSGSEKYFHTFSTGALIVVPIVTEFFVFVVMVLRFRDTDLNCVYANLRERSEERRVGKGWRG